MVDHWQGSPSEVTVTTPTAPIPSTELRCLGVYCISAPPLFASTSHHASVNSRHAPTGYKFSIHHFSQYCYASESLHSHL
ncbi:hypothetical protein BGY98DRAFT_994783 [Russula aff. rugulosa BPL654]|nr:hypothetical protein BGY98DRAFT_994783 [Russula aff. rugulosa BPL654]